MVYRKRIILSALSFLFLGAALFSTPALAANTCGGVDTSIISCDQEGGNAIWSLLEIVVNVLAGLIGLVAIGGLVYGAVLYSSAGDNASQVTKSKTTIANVVVGLVLFAGMYSFLQFLIPGGIFGRELNTPVASNTAGNGQNKGSKTKESSKTASAIIQLHSSGRFDRAVSQWKTDLQTLNKKYQPSIITLTETDSGRSAVMDWKEWAHTKGESIVAWKTSRWKKEKSEVQELAPNTPSLRPSRVSIVILQDRKTNEKWLWAVTHVPASVDGGNGVFRTKDNKSSEAFIRSQVTKWKAVMRHLPTIVSNKLRQYKVQQDHAVITADWNVNLAQSGWRKKMKEYFPEYKLSNPAGSKGTHGNRTIDTSLVSNQLGVTSWRGLGTIASSDHKPFVVEYKVSK